MAQLEASLSTQLFVRLRTRGLRLTPSGRQLAQDIKVLLEHADSLYESARGLATSLVGELKVGVFSPLAPFRLPAILQTFEVQHPGSRSPSWRPIWRACRPPSSKGSAMSR